MIRFECRFVYFVITEVLVIVITTFATFLMRMTASFPPLPSPIFNSNSNSNSNSSHCVISQLNSLSVGYLCCKCVCVFVVWILINLLSNLIRYNTRKSVV